MTKKRSLYKKPLASAAGFDDYLIREQNFQVKLKEVRKELAGVNDKKEEFRKKNKLLQQELTKLNREISAVKSGTTVKRLERDKTHFEEKAAALEEQLLQASAEVEALRRGKTTLEGQLKTLREESEELQKKHALYITIIKDMERKLAMRKRKRRFSKPRIKQSRKARMSLLLDVQNLYYSSRSIYGGRVDFTKIMAHAVKGRHLVKALAYVVKGPQTDERFFTVLKKAGYQVKEKELIYREDGTKKGNWDVGIVIDSMTMEKDVDVIVLASGDGDFLELVQYLRSKMIRVEIMAFASATSLELRDAADQFYPLSEEFLHEREAKH